MDDEADLIRTAQTEARRMLRATSGADERSQVGMSVGQFRRLAMMMNGLARPQDGARSYFAQPVDGIRAWVPAELLARERERAETLQAQNRALSTRLALIAQPSATSTFATP